LNRGGLAPTILNAANEIAVAAFLNRQIGFLDIPRVVETALDESAGANVEAESLDGVLAADARARELAGNVCRRMMT
jgi:1-deoxy-D-xylulose-5-phosphate reductoisomerase